VITNVTVDVKKMTATAEMIVNVVMTVTAVAMSISSPTERKNLKLTKKHLIDMLAKIPNGSNLGVWIDNGKAYIDRSARISNKRLALKVGKALNQISIYDWKTGDCIPCL